MKRKIAAIMVLVSVMMLSGCSKNYYFGCLGCIPSEERKNWLEDQRSWDADKAKIIAQSYLEEKYVEEFIYVSNSVPSNPYPDDLVVVCDFIRKDDEEVKARWRYQVDVVYKSGEYTVKGDDYMFVYIRKVAEDFLRPYVENRFSDIEFVFFIYSADNQCGVRGEYFADTEIPQSFDELCDVTSGVHFQIIVPISEDQNKVSEACSLLKSDLKELNVKIKIGGYIDVYQNDRFAEISQFSDPWGHETVHYSQEKIM